MPTKSKSYSDTPKLYSAHKTEAAHNILRLTPIILPLLTIMLLTSLSTPSVSALTYQDNVELQFTWNPTIRISLSSADLIIDNLTPGNSADSNTITINVGTNNMYGYTLSATAGNTTNASTNLVNTVDNTKLFTSLATDASLASLTTDNTWGYSFSTNSGTSWSNYSGLPLYTAASGAELVNNDGSGSTPVQFKIAAKASTIQASGAYTNTINFTAVANPEPTPQPISCDAGKICYSENALDSEGTMAEQEATSNTETTLMASNYSRSGYGFAGWSPTMDGSGKIYGPNETITTGDLSSTGMPLYAIWVRSAGSMQDPSTITSVCNSLTKAPIDGTANLSSVSALTDQRDNNTYAIAKLADGKCWMIENLRLADKDSSNNDIELSATNTNSPLLPLTNVYVATNPTTSNHLSASTNPTSTAWCTSNSAACDDQSMLYTGNTTERGTNPATSANTYSYGNYYNWYSATAGNGKYSTSTNNSVTAGDICPTGWTLPESGDKTNMAAEKNNFYKLGLSLGLFAPANYDSQTRPFWTGSPEGSNASTIFRTYPNNFLYSGYVGGSSVRNRGSYGYYWSKSAYSSNYAYNLDFDSSGVRPSDNYGKSYGSSVRCLAQ